MIRLICRCRLSRRGGGGVDGSGVAPILALRSSSIAWMKVSPSTPSPRSDAANEGSRHVPMMGARGNGSAPAGATTLLTLVYAGKASQLMSLPSRLVSVDLLLRASRIRRFDLGQGMGSMQGGMSFTINGRTFDPKRVDSQVALNEIEDWEFTNAATMDHPMHIHTNPFQVIGTDGAPIPAWKDVVLVPARSRVRVRTAFRDFAGVAMYHCRILDHEDLGMMGTVEFKG